MLFVLCVENACFLSQCVSRALSEYHTIQPFCLAADLWEGRSGFVLWKNIKKLCIHLRCRTSPTSVLQKVLLSCHGRKSGTICLWEIHISSFLTLYDLLGVCKARAYFLSCFHVSCELKFNRASQSLISQHYLLLSQRQKIFCWMEVPTQSLSLIWR